MDWVIGAVNYAPTAVPGKNEIAAAPRALFFSLAHCAYGRIEALTLCHAAHTLSNGALYVRHMHTIARSRIVSLVASAHAQPISQAALKFSSSQLSCA